MQKRIAGKQLYKSSRLQLGSFLTALGLVIILGAGISIVRSNISVHAVTPPDACFDFNSGTGTIENYYDNEDDVTENPTCTRDVDIPATIGGVAVTAIGDNAFEAKGLTSVSLPDSVVQIGSLAFYDNALETVTVGTSGFGGTPTLSIEGQFNDSTITSVVLGNNVLRVTNGSFAGGAITSLDLGESIQEVSNSAFAGSPITSLSLPDSLVTIDGFGFGNLSELTSLDLGNGLQTIGPGAFLSNKLTSLSIPNSVTSIQGGAFGNSSELLTVTVGDGSFVGSPTLALGSGFLSGSSCKVETVVINDSVQAITGGAFGDCPVTSLSIADSVEEISYAFNDSGIPGGGICVQNLYIPSSVTTLNDSFTRTDCFESITIGEPGYVGAAQLVLNNVFNDMPALTTLNLYDNVLATEGSALNNTPALTNLRLSQQMTRIIYGFRNAKISSLTTPASLTTLTDAFNKNSELRTLTIGGSPTLTYAFAGSNLDKVFFQGTPTLTNSGNFYFAGFPADDSTSAITYTDYNTEVLPYAKYVPIYTSQPNLYSDTTYNEGLGDEGGYLINPVGYTVNYRSNTGVTLLPSVFKTGEGLASFLISDNPSGDLSGYYRIGDDVPETAPAVTGYTTPQPAVASLTLAFVQAGAELTLIYTPLVPAEGGAETPGAPDTGFAFPTLVAPWAIAAGLIILAGVVATAIFVTLRRTFKN